MNPRILIVDDESTIREICAEVLTKMGFEPVVTGDPLHALNIALKDHFDLVITDIKMPKMNGIELMRRIRQEKPSMPFIIVTGFGTYNLVIEALREGAYDFISKPFRIEELEVSVKNTFEKVALTKELSRIKTLNHVFNISKNTLLSKDRFQASTILLECIMKETNAAEGVIYIEDNWTGELKEIHSIPRKTSLNNRMIQDIYTKGTSRCDANTMFVIIRESHRDIGIIFLSKKDAAFSRSDQEITAILADNLGVAIENISLFENLQKKISGIENRFFETVRGFCNAVDSKSLWTKGHSERVSNLSLMVAQELNLSDEATKITELSALLHDIGKIGTYDYLLDKPGKLLPDEYQLVRKHPEKSAAILSSVTDLKDVLNIILHHHEHYDGKGYPEGISGQDIPLISRVISVADSFDAMTSDRPYRKTPGKEKAVEELLRCAGSQFDPEVVHAFLRAIEHNA